MKWLSNVCCDNQGECQKVNIIKNENENTLQIQQRQKYYLKLYINTFENFGEMCKFLGKNNLPKPTQEEIENLNDLMINSTGNLSFLIQRKHSPEV